jgi:hypothetical protein
MSVLLKVAGLCILMAGSVLGQSSQVMLQDDFADGVRDRTVWKASGQSGSMVEQNGRLYYTTVGTSAHASWIAKRNYTPFVGDKLTLEALVNIGPVYLPEPSQVVKIGLGFNDAYPTATRACLVYVMQYQGLMEVIAEVYTPDRAPRGRRFALPMRTRTILTLEYNTVTGTITVMHRSPGSMFSVVAGTIPLNRWWGIPVGTPAPLTPILAAESMGTTVGFGKKLFVDDPVVTITIP